MIYNVITDIIEIKYPTKLFRNRIKGFKAGETVQAGLASIEVREWRHGVIPVALNGFSNALRYTYREAQDLLGNDCYLADVAQLKSGVELKDIRYDNLKESLTLYPAWRSNRSRYFLCAQVQK